MALSALMMFSFGMMVANFTALAMEPQGAIAGTASSLYGTITTLLGIVLGITIGQDFDGTLVPFSTGFLLCTLGTLAVVVNHRKGPAVPAAQQAGDLRTAVRGRMLRRLVTLAEIARLLRTAARGSYAEHKIHPFQAVVEGASPFCSATSLRGAHAQGESAETVWPMPDGKRRPPEAEGINSAALAKLIAFGKT